MAYSIAQLKTDLQGTIRGTNLNKVTGPNDLISRAGRKLIADIDLHESEVYQQITNPFFDQVYNYVIPTEVSGERIFDIRPIGSKEAHKLFYQVYGRDFHREKNNFDNQRFAVQRNAGVKTLKVDLDEFPPVVLHTMDSLTDNGTWTAAGSASGLEIDKLQKYTGSGAVRVDLTSTSGYIENSTIDQVDLSDFTLNSAFFIPSYFPSVTNLTSVELRVGSDASNYHSRTITTNHLGAFTDGFNLLRFNFDGMTETGTVDDDNIDYLRVTVVSGAAISDVRFDSITNNQGEIYELGFYSKYIFSNSSGTRLENVASDDDTVNLETETYNLLLDLCAIFAFQQINDDGNSSDIRFWEKQYKQDKQRYTDKYRSQVVAPRETYYKTPFKRRIG